MSQRGKRGNHLHHSRLDVEPQPPPTKRRKGRPPNSGGGGTSGGLNGGGGGSGLGNNAISSGNSGTSINFGNTNEIGAQTPGAAVGVTDELPSSAKVAGSSSAIAWQARSVADIKMSSIYNRSSTEAPAELYRLDLQNYVDYMFSF